VVLPLIDQSLIELLRAAASKNLRSSSVAMSADKTVGVVIASRGYPETSGSGAEVTGIEAAEHLPGVTVLHAGTAIRAGRLETHGGRVLTVVGRASSFAEAIDRAYAGVRHISFDGMQFRSDIGQKAVAPSTLPG